MPVPARAAPHARPDHSALNEISARSRGRNLFLNRLAATLLLLLTLAQTVVPAAAHSEDAILQVANVLAGPFTLSVWTYPALPRAGTIHFSVLVLDTATGQPLRDPTVLIEAKPNDSHIHAAAVQNHTYLEPISLFQEADLPLLTPGPYQVTVQVTDENGAQGQTAFNLEIVSATGYKWLVIILLGQAVLFALWLLKEGVRTWGLDRLFSKRATTSP